MHRALQGDIVETRIIRSNYGIFYKTPWDPEIHEKGKYARTAAKLKYVPPPASFSLSDTTTRKFDDQEEKWFCTKVMNWYVKRLC